DPEGIPQFGLVAEEVERINPDLVARDEQGRPYTVRYDAVNAMLLNEFLKEHRKVETQQRKIDEQEMMIRQLGSSVAQQKKRFESKLAKQEEQIAVLTSDLHKVCAQVELNKAKAQTVAER